jgi:hypothetical protein
VKSAGISGSAPPRSDAIFDHRRRFSLFDSHVEIQVLDLDDI